MYNNAKEFEEHELAQTWPINKVKLQLLLEWRNSQ